MRSASSSGVSWRCGRIVGLISLLLFGLTVATLWYGVNSDKDDVPSILTQLIPAGHCACKTSTTFQCSSCLDSQTALTDHDSPHVWEYSYERNKNDETLDEKQCLAAFPGLFEDTKLGTKYWFVNGNVSTEALDDLRMINGMSRAMIYKGQLYVLATKSKAEDHRRKMIAVLSSIHRALIAAPDRPALPNIEFVFTVEDKAADVGGNGHPLWVLARKATEEYLWLMPDFGFWSWDNIIEGENHEIG